MLNSTKINKPKEQARITQIVLNTRGLNYGTPLATPQASEPLRHSTQYLKHPTLPLSIFKPNTSMYNILAMCNDLWHGAIRKYRAGVLQESFCHPTKKNLKTRFGLGWGSSIICAIIIAKKVSSHDKNNILLEEGNEIVVVRQVKFSLGD